MLEGSSLRETLIVVNVAGLGAVALLLLSWRAGLRKWRLALRMPALVLQCVGIACLLPAIERAGGHPALGMSLAGLCIGAVGAIVSPRERYASFVVSAGLLMGAITAADWRVPPLQVEARPSWAALLIASAILLSRVVSLRAVQKRAVSLPIIGYAVADLFLALMSYRYRGVFVVDDPWACLVQIPGLVAVMAVTVPAFRPDGSQRRGATVLAWVSAFLGVTLTLAGPWLLGSLGISSGFL